MYRALHHSPGCGSRGAMGRLLHASQRKVGDAAGPRPHFGVAGRALLGLIPAGSEWAGKGQGLQPGAAAAHFCRVRVRKKDPEHPEPRALRGAWACLCLCTPVACGCIQETGLWGRDPAHGAAGCANPRLWSAKRPGHPESSCGPGRSGAEKTLFTVTWQTLDPC